MEKAHSFSDHEQKRREDLLIIQPLVLIEKSEEENGIRKVRKMKNEISIGDVWLEKFWGKKTDTDFILLQRKRRHESRL